MIDNLDIKLPKRAIDITNQQFNYLTAIKYIGTNKFHLSQWLFKCKCGNEKITSAVYVRKGLIKSCGCFKITKREKQKRNLIGLKFGRFTVLEHKGRNKYGQSIWLCKCDCGQEKVIVGSYLVVGRIKSCGCLKHVPRGSNAKNLLGLRFKYLFVESPNGMFKYGKSMTWNCLCDCGNYIVATSHSLTSGKISSCGCKRDLNKFKKKEGTPLKCLYHNYKKNAKERGLAFNITIEDFKVIINKPCYYCGILPLQVAPSWSDEKLLYNGIDRVDSNVGYEKNNIVACCYKCNYAKQSMSIQEFKDWIIKTYNYLKSKQWDLL